MIPIAQAKNFTKAVAGKVGPKFRPKRIIEAVEMLSSDTPEGKVHLATLGQYLKRTDPGFSGTVPCLFRVSIAFVIPERCTGFLKSNLDRVTRTSTSWRIDEQSPIQSSSFEPPWR